MNFSTTLDLSYLEKMSAGDRNTKKMMLRMLLEELEKDLPRLRSLIETEDWDQIARFCHHFKSTLVFSGSNSMLEANRRIWDHAKRNGRTSTRLGAQMRTLESQSKRVKSEVSRVLRTL